LLALLGAHHILHVSRIRVNIMHVINRNFSAFFEGYNLRAIGNKGLRWVHIVVMWGYDAPSFRRYILPPTSSQIPTLNIGMNLQCNENLRCNCKDIRT
jgi:hypothetical protein